MTDPNSRAAKIGRGVFGVLVSGLLIGLMERLGQAMWPQWWFWPIMIVGAVVVISLLAGVVVSIFGKTPSASNLVVPAAQIPELVAAGVSSAEIVEQARIGGELVRDAGVAAGISLRPVIAEVEMRVKFGNGRESTVKLVNVDGTLDVTYGVRRKMNSHLVSFVEHEHDGSAQIECRLRGEVVKE